MPRSARDGVGERRLRGGATGAGPDGTVDPIIGGPGPLVVSTEESQPAEGSRKSQFGQRNEQRDSNNDCALAGSYA